MAYPNFLPNDLTRLLCVGVTSSVLALGTAFAQEAAPAADTANMTEGQRQAAEGAANLAKGGEDEPTIHEVPAPDANRVYINDPAHFAAITQQFIIDGAEGQVVGMTDGGFLPNPVISEDGAMQAQVSTVFERVARGKRTDYVEVFDPKTLKPIADIELPNTPRFLVGTYPWMSAVTPNKNTLMFYQFSPSPAVGLVNLADKKFDRMIDVPDCYHMFPTTDETFYMHCRDGSMARVDFAGAEPKITHSEVFHSEDDHLLNNPAYSMKAKKLVWPTYTGKIFPIDLSGDAAKVGKPIETFTEAEIKEGWAPGGWQPTAFHRLKDRIYVLGDQREQWTHKDPSRFVFVIDAKTGERLQKFDMGHEIDAINVSQNAEGTLLYGLSAGERTLYVYDEATGKELRSVNELGRGPQVITVLDLES